jgi:hypothetical protein
MMSDVLEETPYVFSGDITPSFSRENFPDRPYLGAGFVNVNRTRINVVYVARMENNTMERGVLRVELSNVGAAGDTFQVTCSVNDDVLSVPPAAGVTRTCAGINGTTTEVVVVSTEGSLSLPHDYQATSPSLLRLRLVKV